MFQNVGAQLVMRATPFPTDLLKEVHPHLVVTSGDQHVQRWWKKFNSSMQM